MGALAVLPTVAVAWGSDYWPTRHYRHTHHLYLRRATREAVAPGKAVATNWPAWLPFTRPPPPLVWPHIAPYPPGEGDTDGLSTDIDDCNKGCIGGQPD